MLYLCVVINLFNDYPLLICILCVDKELKKNQNHYLILDVYLTWQARAGIREVHFLPFNPVDKRTALTYIDSDGSWHRASKGAPEQVYFVFIVSNGA